MKHNDTVKYSILILTIAGIRVHPALCIFYEFIIKGF